VAPDLPPPVSLAVALTVFLAVLAVFLAVFLAAVLPEVPEREDFERDFPAVDALPGMPAVDVVPGLRAVDVVPDVLPRELPVLELLPPAPAFRDAAFALVAVLPASAIPAHPPVHVAERVVRLSPGCFP
jgi:hypothetical protein